MDATQSGVISLAHSFGCPVIASDTGGLKEQLNKGEIGLFCKIGNAKELCEKMFCLNNDRQRLYV